MEQGEARKTQEYRNSMKTRGRCFLSLLGAEEVVSDQADVNNSGECIPATLHLNKVDIDRDHSLDIAFSCFDQNEDGCISKHEIQQVLEGTKDVRLERNILRSFQDYSIEVLHAFYEADELRDRLRHIEACYAAVYDFSNVQLEYYKKTLGSLKPDSTKKIEKDYVANREFVLPLYMKTLRNTPQDEKSLTWKAFMHHTRESVLNIPPKYHGALLILCGSFLGYQTKNTTAPFDFGFKKSTNAPQSLLFTFGEAFESFFPEITHITKFMLCYFLTLILVVPLQLGVQIFCMLLLISAPLFYFPELVRKASASGVDVACGGSFKLPLIGFATLGAVGLSLICGIMTLIMVYLSWRFLYKGKSTVKEIEVSLDDLSQILG